MALPANVTVVHSNRYPSLSALREALLLAPTDYVIAVRSNDRLTIDGPVTGDICYLPSAIGTRRYSGYPRPAIPFDPLLLIQWNYMGHPVVRKELAALLPDTAQEPWHVLLVRAWLQGASFSQVAGLHTLVLTYPWPEESPAYSPFCFPFDTRAIEEAVPTIQAERINHRAYFQMREVRQKGIHVFHRGCSEEFLNSLAGYSVTLQHMPIPDMNLMLSSEAEYIAWFEDVRSSAERDLFGRLLPALEFPSVRYVSPRLVDGYLYEPAPADFGISSGLHPGAIHKAWIARRASLLSPIPNLGHVLGHAVLDVSS